MGIKKILNFMLISDQKELFGKNVPKKDNHKHQFFLKIRLSPQNKCFLGLAFFWCMNMDTDMKTDIGYTHGHGNGYAFIFFMVNN
jgi:hypothetical protein